MATITLQSTKKDVMDANNIRVTFTFLTSAGDTVTDGDRIVPVATDLNVFSTNVGTQLLASMKQAEVDAWLSAYVPGRTLKYNTSTEMFTALREAYRNYGQWDLCKLANVFMAYYNAGVITDAQCQNIFNITALQWSSLKTTINNYSTIYIQALSALGQ
jgi:hypothetical protein